ncbi:MAG: hypothetical protein HOC71_10035 [Candidatus Latescibacteria bacterium]|nr:hypothetical protein [Candidatus Latescibacterota bacterium]
MVAKELIGRFCEIFGFIFRICAAFIAFLLILRAIVTRLQQYTSIINCNSLFKYTDVFVRPISKLLPKGICNSRVDYSPLISAIILLFLGFGIQAFFQIIAGEILAY